MAVITVEGIGSTRSKLHPVQERIAKAHGSQCGFCTPGIVMSMYALLRSKPFPDMHDVEVAFQGRVKYSNYMRHQLTLIGSKYFRKFM